MNKKLIDQYGQYKVYTVDGKAMRDMSPEAQEFGGSSIHAYLKCIPENEIWIEDDVPPEEQKVLIASALYQLKQIEDGKKPRMAYDDGLKREKDYRESGALSRKQPWKANRPAPRDIYLGKYGRMESEDIIVYLVDGEKVRNTFKTDFIEGGHGYVYHWVPNKEIWIEKGPHTDAEAPFILLHEYVERTLMKYRKMTYEKAHEIAAKVEFSKRPDKVTEKDVLALTPRQALALANSIKK